MRCCEPTGTNGPILNQHSHTSVCGAKRENTCTLCLGCGACNHCAVHTQPTRCGWVTFLRWLMAGGKRPAPFRTRKLSRLCADGTATGGSWESKTLPQSTVSWGWGTGLETGTYPTPPFLRAHTTRTHVCAHSRHCPSLTSEMHLSDWLSAPKKSPPTHGGRLP